MKYNIKTIACIIIVGLLISSCGGGGDANTNLIPVKQGDSWGYADKTGKLKINPQFSSLSLFKDGLALVSPTSTDGKRLFGYINEEGKYIINPSYIYATQFSEGVAIVTSENEAPKAINKKGETIFTSQTAEQLQSFKEGLAGFSTIAADGKEKWGFVNDKGEVKISPQFIYVRQFSGGKAAVKNDAGKWGFIDKEGKMLINPQFDGVRDFKNGKAIVWSGRQAGVIDEKGQYIINPQFYGIADDGDKYMVNSGGKIGWADKEGKFIINPQFIEGYPFNGNSLAAVHASGGWGYIDKEGKFIINPQFNEAYPFNNGIAAVQNGSQIGFIDEKGKYVVNPQFDGIGSSYTSVLTGTDANTISTVSTDFFDVNTIVQRVRKDITPTSTAGFTFNTKIAEMLTKYNKTVNDFSYYGNKNSLISDEKLGKDATLTFSIGGVIYISRGWSYEINPDATVREFVYTISLSGKADSKKDQIMDAFAKAFPEFKLADANKNEIHLISNQQNITIRQYGFRIEVKVEKGTEIPATQDSATTH